MTATEPAGQTVGSGPLLTASGLSVTFTVGSRKRSGSSGDADCDWEEPDDWAAAGAAATTRARTAHAVMERR